ncbi:hypothetical protein [Massilia sp. TN1-12]|uniref:hypothetical protein n=1 Tax=Massilia paldalensis TaxID=3377675 RepID=UPI00384B8238
MPEIILQTVERIDIVTQATQGLPGIPGPRGLPGPPGGATLEYTAATDVGGHRVVMLDHMAGLVYASATDLSHMGRVIGVTVAAAGAGAQCQVQNFDQLEEPSWNWDTSKPVYLGQDGVLTQMQPSLPSAKFSMVVGFPISSTSLFVNLREPIVLS